MAVGMVITNDGRNLILNRAYLRTQTVINRFRSGTGTDTPVVGDTTLQTSVFGPTAFSSGYPTFDTVANRTTARGVVGSGDANGNTLTEAGEFNLDASPIMLSRMVHTGVSKTSAVIVLYTFRHPYV